MHVTREASRVLSTSLRRRSVLPTAALLVASSGALAQQVAFSIDYGGPTIALPDCSFGQPINEGDILTVCTPTASPMPGFVGTPSLVLTGGFGPPTIGLGIPVYPSTVGHGPGQWGLTEVDALSYGFDGLLDQRDYGNGKLLFSVDNFSQSIPGLLPPAVFTEGPANDAAGDMFQSLALPLSGFPAPAIPIGNTGKYDGDGSPSLNFFTYPALGLVEPTAPLPPTSPTPGDNVDAFDAEVFLPSFFPFFPQGGIYFSLDSHFVDPIHGVQNTGSAQANGFVGGDVLHCFAPGSIAVYAPAGSLGLDLAGPDTDDLDALVLLENGVPGFQPSMNPFDWVGGATDMLLFSVRRGSAVIGVPDAFTGTPIEEGDVLTTVGGGPPGILVPAELLGLLTVRSFGPGPFGPHGDELNALDVLASFDPVVPDCAGDQPALCPCGNSSFPGAAEGCFHSAGIGMKLGGAPGTGTSFSAQDLNLLVSQIPTDPRGPGFSGNSGLFLANTINVGVGPFFDGYNCVAGGPRLLPGADADNDGLRTSGNIIAAGNLVSPGFFAPGGTYWFQYWSRDVLCGPPPAPCPSPCGATANFSSAGMVMLTP